MGFMQSLILNSIRERLPPKRRGGVGLSSIFLLATGVGVMAAQTGAVTGGVTLTLDQAVQMALASHPSLKAYNARVTAAIGRARQSNKWPNPELELRSEEWPVSRGRGFSDAKQIIGLSQTLPYPGKKPLEKKLGDVGVKLAEAELAVRRTEIVREVKAGFYQVLALERMVAVSTQLVAVAESSATTARRRVEAGAAAYQEQLRAEVQLEQARTELTEIQRELAVVRHRLATLLGQPELTDVVLAGRLVESPDDTLASAETPGWVERHPSAAAARINWEEARLAHRRARLEPYPDVKMSVAGGRIGETDQGIIEVGITLPLPVLDRGKGRQQEALAQVSVAEAEWRRVCHQLQQEWAGAQKRYLAAAEQVTRYRKQILPKAEEALRLVQNGFEEGKFPFMDWLDTQRMAAEARLLYWQKVLEMHLAMAEREALLTPESHVSSSSP